MKSCQPICLDIDLSQICLSNLLNDMIFKSSIFFRNALLDVNTFKGLYSRVNWHKSSKSLDTLSSFSYTELANMPEIVNQLDSDRNDSQEAKQRRITKKLVNKDISIEEYATQLKSIIKNYLMDD